MLCGLPAEPGRSIPPWWTRGGGGSVWHAGGASTAPSPGTPSVLPGRKGAGEEVRAVSKPKGRHVEVRKGKVTARKVSDVLTGVACLIRAIGVLVDALGKWFG